MKQAFLGSFVRRLSALSRPGCCLGISSEQTFMHDDHESLWQASVETGEAQQSKGGFRGVVERG